MHISLTSGHRYWDSGVLPKLGMAGGRGMSIGGKGDIKTIKEEEEEACQEILIHSQDWGSLVTQCAIPRPEASISPESILERQTLTLPADLL